MRICDEAIESTKVADYWLESAICIALLARIKRASPDQMAKHLRLLELGRLQFSVEESFRRIQQGSQLTVDDDYLVSMYGIYSQFIDVRTFIVCAHQYWGILRELGSGIEKGIECDELVAAVAKYASVAHDTKLARDHIEHWRERISDGRRAPFGSPMSAETFRKAIGHLKGSTIAFGSEEFHLDAIHAAVREVGRSVGPAVRSFCDLGNRATLKVTAPI